MGAGLLNIGICCMVISVWGILQLAVMGLLFFFEVPIFLEECEAHEYEDYDDFISKTSRNYQKVAINCWIASAVYIVSLGLSIFCIKKAKRDAERLAKLMEDDEYVCDPDQLIVPEKRKKT